MNIKLVTDIRCDIQVEFLTKDDIKNCSSYFQETGIDYIVSPFSILYEYMQKILQKNFIKLVKVETKLYKALGLVYL